MHSGLIEKQWSLFDLVELLPLLASLGPVVGQIEGLYSKAFLETLLVLVEVLLSKALILSLFLF